MHDINTICKLYELLDGDSFSNIDTNLSQLLFSGSVD